MRNPFRSSQPSSASKSAPPEPSPDLLAEAEDAAFDAAVRAYHASKAALNVDSSSKSESETDSVETELVEWKELTTETYQPEIGTVEAVLKRMGQVVPEPIASNWVYVVVRRAAWHTLQTHLREDVTVERGGLLTGRVFADAARATFVVLVEEALPARSGEETATSLAYTVEAWQAILPGLQNLPAGHTIVGSYHSHPGLGVFLSSTDLETQQTVFPHPWQIAVVVDPVADQFGVFFGPNGRGTQVAGIP